MIDKWLLALWAFVFLDLGVLIYIFGRRSVPSSYARSRYVIGIELKMVIAFIVPVLLVGLVFGVAYLFGGLIGLLVPLLALVLVLEGIRAYARSESSYVLSTTQSPRLHEIATEVSAKIDLKRKVEICLCGGCQARTYGWRRPKVALGIPLFDYLTVGEIKAVLAHELGHIKDGDYAIRTFFTMVLTSLQSMFSVCKRAIMGGGNVLLALFMGIAGAFVWLLKGAVEIISLLFMRQGEFMADLHTTVFETDGKPTNFKRSLAKIALLNIAEAEFEKRILTERVLTVREGKLPVSRLFEKPHVDMFYEWMNKVHF